MRKILGLGLGLESKKQVFESYEAETEAYITKATVLGGEIDYKDAVNNLVLDLKSDGLFDKFDCLYLANKEGVGSRVNLINPSIVADVINNVSFTDKKGWIADDAISALDLNYNPSTSTKYTAGKGTLGLFITDSSGTPSVLDLIGAFSNSGQYEYVSYNNGTTYFSLYQSGFPFVLSKATVTIDNYISASRNTTEDILLYSDQAYAGNNTNYLVALPTTHNFYGLAYNNGGFVSVSNNQTKTTGAFFVGEYLTEAEHIILKGLLNSYFTAIGGI